MINIETFEKRVSERLMENVHPAANPAGRNWGPARRVGSPSEARTNPEEGGYIEVRRSDLPC
jgi:hypothetical protein